MSDQQDSPTTRSGDRTLDWGEVLCWLSCLLIAGMTLGAAYLTALPLADGPIERLMTTGVLFMAYGIGLGFLYWVVEQFQTDWGNEGVVVTVKLLAVPLGAFVGLAMLKLSYLVLFVW